MGCRGRAARLDVVELDDPASSTGAAGMQMRLYLPIFSSFGQFGLYILAFEKQGFGAPSHQRFRKADELV
jgi:hypothetical protein